MLQLPPELQRQISTYIQNLPMIENPNTRRAILNQAGLDPDLKKQIVCEQTSMNFISNLIDTLLRYGQLYDDRYALEEFLKASKTLVGKDRQAECDQLLSQIRTQRLHKSETEELEAALKEARMQKEKKKQETKSGGNAKRRKRSARRKKKPSKLVKQIEEVVKVGLLIFFVVAGVQWFTSYAKNKNRMPYPPPLFSQGVINSVTVEQTCMQDAIQGVCVHIDWKPIPVTKTSYTLIAYFGFKEDNKNYYFRGESASPHYHTKTQTWNSGKSVLCASQTIPVNTGIQLQHLPTTLFLPDEELNVKRGKIRQLFSDVVIYHGPTERFIALFENAEFQYYRPNGL